MRHADKVIQLWIEVCQIYFKNLILRQLSVKFKHRYRYCFSVLNRVLIYYFPKLQECGPKVINLKLKFGKIRAYLSLACSFRRSVCWEQRETLGFNSVTNGERKMAMPTPLPSFFARRLLCCSQTNRTPGTRDWCEKYWLPGGVRQTSNSQ